MRLSQNFTRTKKDAPKDEVSKNARLLIRAGFIHKELAGVYDYLPLGLRVLKKIEAIIREEMNAIGGQELYLTTLQNPEIWKTSGRWVDEDADPTQGLPWFRTKLAGGTELGIGNTHEEPLASIMKQHINSYKDLPVYAYQFQNKFRNELRAKSGLMRGREFMMKDLYSFTRDEKELEDYYEMAAKAYTKIFDRVGLGDITFRTFASGGAFSKFSDEFQTLSEAGEDTIYIDRKKNIAVNREVYTDEVLAEIGLDKTKLEEAKAIEVGNIFKLGTKYASAVGLKYVDEQGKEHPVVMGCYGIGLGRLMGTIVEIKSDERGIIWPEAVAPAIFHLIVLGDDPKVRQAADKLYEELTKKGQEVIYDDREESAGAKFADADLIGCPIRATISAKTLEKDAVETKERGQTDSKIIGIAEFLKQVK